MYPDAVKHAQRVLRALSDYRGAIDGKVGRQSLAAAWRAPFMDAQETILGPIDPIRRVILAAQIFLAQDGFDVGSPDGFWGPQTDAAFADWRGDPLPVRRSDVAGWLGPAGSPACTAGRINVPWAMVLAWDEGTRIATISCHELVAASAQIAFDKIAAEYTQPQLIDLGLHLFGGCYNFRKKRGGSSLSTHAYGGAIDFDPVRNQLRWRADRARLAQRDARPFWAAWESVGWVSLGRARNFDWMHVQAVAL